MKTWWNYRQKHSWTIECNLLCKIIMIGENLCRLSEDKFLQQFLQQQFCWTIISLEIITCISCHAVNLFSMHAIGWMLDCLVLIWSHEFFLVRNKWIIFMRILADIHVSHDWTNDKRFLWDQSLIGTAGFAIFGHDLRFLDILKVEATTKPISVSRRNFYQHSLNICKDF